MQGTSPAGSATCDSIVPAKQITIPIPTGSLLTRIYFHWNNNVSPAKITKLEFYINEISSYTYTSPNYSVTDTYNGHLQPWAGFEFVGIYGEGRGNHCENFCFQPYFRQGTPATCSPVPTDITLDVTGISGLSFIVNSDGSSTRTFTATDN